MKKYILPILTALILSLSACNSETKTADAVEETTTTPTKVEAIPTQPQSIKETAPTTTTVAATTSMTVDRKVHDFGAISDQAPVTTKFTLTNTGSEPLIITQAKGSCGCTVPKKPEAPILPGETGEIEVTFNPKGKNGAQNKTVTIIANTQPANTVINVKSTVTKTTPPAAK